MFAISDPKSPYFMILVKSLDLLTTWMFLSQGLSEGNPLARAGILNYGFLPMAFFAMMITFVYTKWLHILWNIADHRLLKGVLNLTFSFGMILNIIVPLYNWYWMSRAHFLS